METKKEKKSVLCPIHENVLMLEERNGKMVAICNCHTGGEKNKWKGQIVHREDLPKPAKDKKRSKSGGVK